jgi:hypothetical protein
LRESSFRTTTGTASVAGFFFENSPTIRLRKQYPAAATAAAADWIASSPVPGSTYAIARRSLASSRKKHVITLKQVATKRFFMNNSSIVYGNAADA